MIRLFRLSTRSCLSISFAEIGINPDASLTGDAEFVIIQTCKIKYGGWRVLSITDKFQKSVVLEN